MDVRVWERVSLGKGIVPMFECILEQIHAGGYGDDSQVGFKGMI